MTRKMNSSVMKEEGIALVLALMMLLMLSTLALTISFTAHMDYKSMQSFKRGQEAFVAAEHCVQEARKLFETTGIEVVFFNLQGGQRNGFARTLPDGSYCRTGKRFFENTDTVVKADATYLTPPLIDIPSATKVLGRPIKHVSLPSGGVGGAALVPSFFTVIGKHAGDKDSLLDIGEEAGHDKIPDNDNNINTGVEIAIGLESFIPGGASNVY